jgi:hypothetical protein
MRTSPLRRLALGLVVPAALAVGLAACGDSDVSKSKFSSELQDEAGLTEAQADCVVDNLYEEFDQGEINDLYSADTEDEAPEGGLEALQTATTECVTPEG